MPTIVRKLTIISVMMLLKAVSSRSWLGKILKNIY